ncbi:tyrosine-type recombinase/integrase [Tropicimonas sp. S265A]|uniref:tyrosine-type recombinase/integrase n=1 Tax=Tropicimonas sp. S265A TaxID=3415134 RepID=UPI003C7E02A3
MNAYAVSRNTVSNWAKAGLVPSVKGRVHIFRGATVVAFHHARRSRTKQNLRPGEFKCTECKNAVFPSKETISCGSAKSGGLLLEATCPECNAHLFKFGTKADLAPINQTLDPNTTGDSAHEENTLVLGGIGIESVITPSPNDALIYRWQAYAGKFSEKTQDRHLSAIRQFEVFLGNKAFKKLTLADCHKVRDHFKASLKPDAVERKSKSTVQHSVSHLRDFLDWLCKQEDYRHLPADLPDALELPRAVYAKALPRDRKDYPSVEEAEQLLIQMPSRSVGDLRNRALFALAFLGALRADTLSSLRLRNIDCDTRLIVQNAEIARAKNGKSLRVKWFPINDTFQAAVKKWVTLMEQGGFGPDDALFPPLDAFYHFQKAGKYLGKAVPVMTSTHAITEAFRAACSSHTSTYTPHSVKHTISSERDRRPLTAEQRKAWSENMGHENEQITERHYGKLSDEQRFELLEVVETETSLASIDAIPNDVKIELFDRVIAEMQKRRVIRDG